MISFSIRWTKRVLWWAAILLVATADLVAAQSRADDSSNKHGLSFFSPWFGAGFGAGAVDMPAQHLAAGPFGRRLDAGVEIASTIRLSIDDYAQRGFIILEDAKNGASFRTVTAGARLWSRLIVEGGLGGGTYTLDQSQVANNPSAREVGLEFVHGPHPVDGGFYVRFYDTHLGPSSTAPNRYHLRGAVVGAAVQIHLIDAIMDYYQKP